MADLFCSCGGLTVGFAEAANEAGLALEIPLAIDDDPTALGVYRANFPNASVRQAKVETIFPGDLGARFSKSEGALAEEVGELDVLVAGPPCQGHSGLNNHTRGDDPRNVLYERVVRAAEVLAPIAVVIENVPGVVHAKEGIVPAAVKRLRELDYAVHEHTLVSDELGIPQRRRRHLLLAIRGGPAPKDLLDGLPTFDVPRDVRWAIGDLDGIEAERDFDRASVMSDENRERAEWLLEHDAYDLPNNRRPDCHRDKKHSYKSMYGRLRWNEPAQTVTTGFGSPGQGRYIHPAAARTITPHEAARLQTFPDWFDFESTGRRTAWARMIGNAVPPLVALRVASVVLPALRGTSEIDLKAAA